MVVVLLTFSIQVQSLLPLSCLGRALTALRPAKKDTRSATRIVDGIGAAEREF